MPKTHATMRKTDICSEIAINLGDTTNRVKAVLDAYTELVVRELNAADEFKILGLVKLVKVRKKAVKGGQVKPNPFKPGETIVTKDRPARTVVKARPLAAIKNAL
jgi:nucleoid DNA-binding protein